LRSTVIQLLDLYGVTAPRRGDLLQLLKESAQRGWLRQYRDELPEVYTDYISLEDDARSISNYESLLIPGLLQTEAYLRAHFRGTHPHATAEDIESRVGARMQRQVLLDRDTPPKLWAIMDEAAIRRLVGGRDVMRDQAQHLRETATRPNVTIQVVPFDAGAHPGMEGTFVILEFAGLADPSVVYTETAAGGLFLEEDAELERYRLMFEHLRATALSPDATVALLGAVIAEA
jgi:hypothetical protein